MTFLPTVALTESTESDGEGTKEPMKIFYEVIAQQTPSERFASGAVFDISRIYRGQFEEIVLSSDALELWKFFASAYLVYCENPEIVGTLDSG